MCSLTQWEEFFLSVTYVKPQHCLLYVPQDFICPSYLDKAGGGKGQGIGHRVNFGSPLHPQQLARCPGTLQTLTKEIFE